MKFLFFKHSLHLCLEEYLICINAIADHFRLLSFKCYRYENIYVASLPVDSPVVSVESLPGEESVASLVEAPSLDAPSDDPPSVDVSVPSVESVESVPAQNTYIYYPLGFEI